MNIKKYLRSIVKEPEGHDIFMERLSYRLEELSDNDDRTESLEQVRRREARFTVGLYTVSSSLAAAGVVAIAIVILSSEYIINLINTLSI